MTLGDVILTRESLMSDEEIEHLFATGWEERTWLNADDAAWAHIARAIGPENHRLIARFNLKKRVHLTLCFLNSEGLAAVSRLPKNLQDASTKHRRRLN